MTTKTSELTIALAQIAPVWLNRAATTDKVIDSIATAAKQGAQLVAFGESLLPGYPFWLELTGGAEFNSRRQKELHSHYAQNAVSIEDGDLDKVTDVCKKLNIACYLGVIERPRDRGGKSLYCSMVYIDQQGLICSVHRKLMPTYEERLTWSPGDGHGLRVHALGAFTVGGLNCWENWMPLARSALYAQGEDLHVAIWPGGLHNTRDLTRFIAREARSYVLSVSGLMRPADVPMDIPHRDAILGISNDAASGSSADTPKDFYANGGSCLASPDGEWLIEPIVGEEIIQLATIDHKRVLEERQNFDLSGHYSRPDVTKLTVDRSRQSTVKFNE